MATRKLYRSVIGVRRENGVGGLVLRGCDHISRYHSTPDSAHRCLATRMRAALSEPLLEVTAKIQYTHSRHDWFDA